MASAATCPCRVEGQADDHERSIGKISQGACEPRIWFSRDRLSWSQSALSGFHRLIPCKAATGLSRAWVGAFSHTWVGREPCAQPLFCLQG